MIDPWTLSTGHFKDLYTTRPDVQQHRNVVGVEREPTNRLTNQNKNDLVLKYVGVNH